MSYEETIQFDTDTHITHELVDCIKLNVLYIEYKGSINYIILNEEFIKKELKEFEDENTEYYIKITKKEAKFLTNTIDYIRARSQYCLDVSDLYEKLSNCINNKESKNIDIKSRYHVTTRYYGDEDRYMLIDIDINKPLKQNFTIKDLLIRLNTEFNTLNISACTDDNIIHIEQRINATTCNRREVIEAAEHII
jgi:hypothetical protein